MKRLTRQIPANKCFGVFAEKSILTRLGHSVSKHHIEYNGFFFRLEDILSIIIDEIFLALKSVFFRALGT